MIDTKKITVPLLKKWLVKIYSPDILKVFNVHLHTEGGHTRNFKIESDPQLTSNPIVIWIVTKHNSNMTPNGKVMVRNMDNYNPFASGIHNVSSMHLMYKRLETEMNNALEQIKFIVKYGHFTTNFGWFDLLKFMKKHHFQYIRRTKDKWNEYLRGIFEYIPKETPETPYELHCPEISFDYKTRKVGGYVDGTKKCQKMYNHFASYICDYFLCNTGYDASEIRPTEISDKTIHDTFKQIISKAKAKGEIK